MLSQLLTKETAVLDQMIVFLIIMEVTALCVSDFSIIYRCYNNINGICSGACAFNDREVHVEWTERAAWFCVIEVGPAV